MGAVTPPVLQLLCLITALLLPKLVSSCDEIHECQSIDIKVTTSQITITGLTAEFFLQYITEINGTMIQASDNSWNNTSLMSFVSGTQYVIYYGNDTISCCHNVTTIPGQVFISMNYYKSVDVLGASWTKSAENMSAQST